MIDVIMRNGVMEGGNIGRYVGNKDGDFCWGKGLRVYNSN